MTRVCVGLHWASRPGKPRRHSSDLGTVHSPQQEGFSHRVCLGRRAAGRPCLLPGRAALPPGACSQLRCPAGVGTVTVGVPEVSPAWQEPCRPALTHTEGLFVLYLQRYCGQYFGFLMFWSHTS